MDMSIKPIFISNFEILKGRSPLALAVKQNKKDMIEHLIHIGAPTSSQDKNVCYSLIKLSKTNRFEGRYDISLLSGDG